MRLAKIYIFLFAMFFCTLSFARTPKDTDEFRNTTKLARELRIIIYRSDFEIGSKSIVSRNTSELVKQLKNCPQIGDGGAVATILALYKGYFTFQSSEIVQTVYDSITNSNCLTCFHYCDSMLTDNCWSYKDEKRGIYYPFYSYSYSHIILPILIESEFDSMANFKYQRYPHPNMYHYKHYPTAQILTELGLYDLAWRIYFETIWYSGEITFL
ncbi:MAG: hypothetical protein LBE12_11875, partial [Planctomycetaceae bacterium]|nr:hypothetical protein [Planctomycetaceae bacterium]